MALSVTVVSRPRFFYAAFYRAMMPLAAPVTIALFPARRVSIVNSPLPRELRLKCSGIFLIGNRHTIDPGLEHVRWLKNHDAALGYRDLDSSLGISPNSLRFGAHEKPAK
jgi:hypothetical protein